MSVCNSSRVIHMALLTAALALPVLADDMVTVPRSRLQELERKEAELEKLKQELNQTQSEKKQLESERQRLKTETMKLEKAKAAADTKAAEAAADTEPAIRHHTPPLTSLPPLQEGEVVDAMDLMNHYRADEPAARKRYGAHAIRVRGELTGFEKPMFLRYYVIYLKTTDRNWKVMCRVYPPENYSAVFTIKGGDEIVGSTRDGGRSTIARLGQKIVVAGWCKGLSGQIVILSGCTLQAAQ